jgi:hypothetical protein
VSHADAETYGSKQQFKTNHVGKGMGGSPCLDVVVRRLLPVASRGESVNDVKLDSEEVGPHLLGCP